MFAKNIIIFIFTQRTYKVNDLIVGYYNGIKIMKYLKEKHNPIIEKTRKMRHSDYLFISKLR